MKRISLNFTQVATALRDLAGALGSQRIWILLDEWSSTPPAIQPYLGAFLVQCHLPLTALTVKIAAIEQQTNFRTEAPDGRQIGIEVGADISANLDLDEFMVFEQNEELARQFFLGLFHKHVLADIDDETAALLRTPNDLVRHGFTHKRAFDELVRAAEGVPRDAINIASRAAQRAGEGRIFLPPTRWLHATLRTERTIEGGTHRTVVLICVLCHTDAV